MTVHPIDRRAHPTERDDCAAQVRRSTFYFGGTEHWAARIRAINIGGRWRSCLLWIHPNTERNACPHKDQRKKDGRLNQAREL
jgi:hypothetical protein